MRKLVNRACFSFFLMMLVFTTAVLANQVGVSSERAVAVGSRANTKTKRSERSGAEILWDTWGVPHIFAQDEASAFRAFGWAQMHNDAGVLLRLIAQGRGRGAEFYGSEYLAADRTVRTLRLYATARTWYWQQNPRFRRDLDAFAVGINEYAQEHPEKLESGSKLILPVNGIDVLAHTTRVLEMFLSGTSGKAGGGCSVPDHDEDGVKGSNGWAIGPLHSADGHAMLLANPHLPWSGEYTFFEAQISAPGYEAYGAALIGFPVLSIAFNDTHGWTHTVNPIHACDTYALVTEKDGYKYDGRIHEFDVDTEVVKVRQKDGSLKSQPIEVRRSVIGPVIEKGGRFFAIRVAGLQAGTYAGALHEWWEMGRARTFVQFHAALNRMQLPMFNVIYADRDGNIELLYNGLVPRRNGQAYSQGGILSGDRSSLIWNEFYGYKDLPKAINPVSGWVQNSNSVPWYMTEPFLDPSRYPPNIAPRGEPSIREQRGMRMLQQRPTVSFEELLAYQYSTHCELADRVLNELIAAAEQSPNPLAREAAVILEKWDRETNADSKGAVLFDMWLQEAGNNFFSESFDIGRPIDTPRGLRDPNAAVASLVTAAGELQHQNISLDVSWGNIFRLHRGTFDFAGNGGAGGLGIFDVIGYARAKDGTSQSVFGATFMAEVDFSSPLKAKVLLTYGNSSDPDSPHYGDQLALLAKKTWRDPWRTRAQLAHHIEERTLLNSEGER